MDKIEELKKIIDSSNNIVFFGGAGVSTDSKIPDFRSNNGIFKNNKYKYSPDIMLSRTFFDNHRNEFYDFYINEMLYINALPNATHKCLARLEDRGKLRAIITQNVDGLHQKAGSRVVIELHGTTERNYCLKCGEMYDAETFYNLKGKCLSCGGYIKPDIVLYEEPLKNKAINDAKFYISNAEVLIVGGTSLNVYPAAGLIDLFKGRYLVIINKEETLFDKKANLVIHDSISKVLKKVIN